MRLLDIVNGPWAITPEMHEEVQAIYTRHMRGEKLDLAALEARTGLKLNNTQAPMTVSDNGVAVVSMEGVLAKRMNLFNAISGGSSTQLIGAQLAQADEDPNVAAVVLCVDSPGGTVDGTQQLAQQIEGMSKPVYAVVDGMCCSAAYWIASACDAVYITGDTAQVGSIGVIASHVDKSMAQAQAGVRVTEVKAGKFKGQGSPNAPLGLGEQTMQDQVDQLYAVFAADVQRNRGLSDDQLQAAAEGRVFLGKSAIAAGLVDGVSTLDAVIGKAASGASPGANYNAEGAGVVPQAIAEETTTMTEKTQAPAPAVAPAAVAEVAPVAKAPTAEEALAAARAEGAVAERARLAAIDKLAGPGLEALALECKADGSTAEAFAVKALELQKSKASKALSDMQADAEAARTSHAAAPAAAPKSEDKAAPARPDMAVIKAAQEYVTAQAAEGRVVHYADAVAHIRAKAAAVAAA